MDFQVSSKREIRIKKLRKKLLEERPFIGSVAMSMDISVGHSINQHFVPTAATNGSIICFNPEFVDMLDDRDLEKVIKHETMHKALGHMFRIRSLSGVVRSDLIQQAADYAVHDVLTEEGDDIHYHSLEGFEILYDKKYKGWSFERIAHDLQKESNQLQSAQQKNTQSGTKSSGKGNGVSKSNGNEVCSDGSESSDEEGEDGNVDGDLDQGEEEGDDSGAGDKDGSDGVDEEASKPSKKIAGEVIEPTDNNGQRLDIDELKKMEVELREEIVSYHTVASKFSGPGNTAINKTRNINSYIQRKQDWRNVFDQFIGKLGEKQGTTNSRLNRQLLKVGLYIPDDVRENIDWMVIAIDVSGSIDDDLQSKFFDHIQKMVKTVRVRHLSIVPFSDTIHQSSIHELYDVRKIPRKVHGYGGTRFSPIFNWIKRKVSDHEYEERKEPNVCVVFTDLESDDHGEKPANYPVIWVSSMPVFKYPSGYTNLPPFGKVVEIT